MFPQLPWLTPWKKLATILAANVSDAAEMLIVQGSSNFRINIAQLKLLLGGGGGVGAGELLTKAGINGELINAAAFRTALGIDALNFVDALPVANQAARLALSAAAARNVLVKESDTGRGYMLVANGVPSVSGDWILFTDATVAMADIPGLEAALLAKAGINGELINAAAFRTALGIDTLNIIDAVPVANQAARLALSSNVARNALVREADTGISYMLISGGVPSSSGDWLKVADTTPTIADVVGLQSQLDVLGSGILEITPNVTVDPPVSSTRGVGLIGTPEANVHYADIGVTYNDLPVYAESFTGGYSNYYHFRYSGVRWELYNPIGTRLAYADPGGVPLIDSTGWIGEGDFTWDGGVLEEIYVGGTLGGQTSTIRVGHTEYFCVERGLGSSVGYFWTPLATNGYPMNSQPFYPGATEAPDAMNGYQRYTLSGTTSPVTTGLVLKEVPADIFVAVGTWTTTGTDSFLGEGVGTTGIWASLRRLSGNNYRLTICEDAVVIQEWESVHHDSPAPDQALSWTRISGPVTAGPALTENLFTGLPGKVGQTYGYDIIVGEERSASYQQFLCVKDAPYCVWREVALDPSTWGKLVVSAPTQLEARQAIAAAGIGETGRADIGITYKELRLEPTFPAPAFLEDPAYARRFRPCAGTIGDRGCWSEDGTLPDELTYTGKAVFWETSGSSWVVVEVLAGIPNYADSGFYSVDDVATPLDVTNWLPIHLETVMPQLSEVEVIMPEFYDAKGGDVTPEALLDGMEQLDDTQQANALRALRVNGSGSLVNIPVKLWRLVSHLTRMGYTPGGYIAPYRVRSVALGDSVACDISKELAGFFGVGGGDTNLQGWGVEAPAVPTEAVGGNYPLWTSGVFTLYDEWTRTIKGLIRHLDASFAGGTYIELLQYKTPLASLYVGYLAANGYGSFKLQYKVNGGGAWIDATTATILTASGGGSVAAGVVNSNNSGSEVYATAAFALPKADVYHLRLTATAGRVRLAHAAAVLMASGAGAAAGQGLISGAMGYNFSQGGRGIGSHFSQWSQSVLSSALAVISPHIIVYKSLNEWSLLNYQTLWPALAAKLFTAAPNALLVVCGSHPRGAAPENNNAGDIAVDDYLREWCATQNGAIFVDVRQSFPPHLVGYNSSTTSTDDLWSDGVHIYGEAGNLANGDVWVRMMVFEQLRPALQLASLWRPESAVSAVAPFTANELRLFDGLTREGNSPHWNKLILSTHPRLRGEVMLRPIDSNYNAGTGLFEQDVGFGCTASFSSSPRALYLKSNGVDAMTFGHNSNGPIQGFCVGVHDASGANFERTRSGYRFKIPWGVYGMKNGLIAEGRSDSPEDARLFGVDIDATDAAAGTQLWSWYNGSTTTRTGGATTNLSPNITFATGTAPPVGALVTGAGIPVNTVVVSSTTTSAVLSRNATANASGLTFTVVVPSAVVHHGRLNDANTTVFTYDEPTSAVRVHNPVCSTAGTGVRVRSVAVVGSYATKAAGEAAVEVGEVFYDEFTGKTRCRLV